jgi:geranylgeranyl diphosphate synthase type II
MITENVTTESIPAFTLSDYMKDQKMKVTEALEAWFKPQVHEKVVEASCYSLLLPSKRLRPMFCIETCIGLGGKEEDALPAAMALEMVHSYSLVHDDLPAMDNDDLRRGKPTNHRVYGEATAILAGDGLLTSAFEVLAKAGDVDAEVRVAWVKELSEAAGMNGMVLGQQWDMDEVSGASLESVEKLHRKKTAALFAASMVMGAIAAKAPQEVIDHLRNFALDMGLAFQIRDDVLDIEGDASIGKPVKSDERNEKGTYVSAVGLETAKKQYQSWYDQAMTHLGQVQFTCDNRLKDLTRFVVERKV